MARKNEYGKFIISAGEVGQFTVCPEAWRLKMVEQIKTERKAEMERGDELHKEWARKSEHAVELVAGLRMIIALIGVMVVLAMVLR